jgi:phosphate transport system permease protein
MIATGLLFVLVVAVGSRAVHGFRQTFLTLRIEITEADVDPAGARDPQALASADFSSILKRSLRARFPSTVSRTELTELYAIASMIAPDRIRDAALSHGLSVGGADLVRVEVSDEIDAFVKGLIGRELPATDRKITDNQIRWVDSLVADGSMAVAWTRNLFRNGDSREPEVAGLRAALVGTAMTLSVTLILAFPLGVLAAIYLEEFAPKNRWTSLVEVNINNLAAVPSVIFGLLGLAVLLNVFGMPRSSPLVGGVVLALMTLPTLIIAARAAIAAVPSSIREAAMAVGASEVQVVLHHVVPLAMPGILTGGIIGMARALGETAPLLMIGMVAFIVDVPKSLVDAATVLPVQIFIWADSPEKGFVGRTAAATLVLLMFLIAMNASAVVLRRRFEKRW